MATDSATMTRLGDLAEFINGDRGRNYPSAADDESGGIPFISASDIAGGRVDYSGVKRISRAAFDRLSNGKVETGDLLFCLRGSVGKVARVTSGEHSAIASSLVILRAKEDTDPRFLYYLMVSPLAQRLAGGLDNGSVQANVSVRDMSRLRVPCPPLPEQRRIAHILGTLDDKIELNRRMNETLEAMARALFKSWFVDFDPVRAKTEGRDPGLPPHLADLFPSRLVDSPLGPIPEGWEVSLIAEHADCVKGRSYSSDELRTSDTALVTLKSFARGGGYRPGGLKPYTGPFKEEQVVVPGDLIVAATDVTQAAEVIGRPAFIESDRRFSTLVASLDVLIVRARSERLPTPYLYWLFRAEEFEQHTNSHATGTTVLHLSPDAVPSYRFPLPPPALVGVFASLAGAAFDRADLASGESSTLSRARKTLLPALFGGGSPQ